MRKIAWCVALPLLVASAAAAAQQIVFASIDDARAVLARSDAYSQSMSDFDRAARLAADRTVTEQEFLAFAARAALAWTEADQAEVGAALDAVVPAASRLALPLPPTVLFVKTSGAEDGEAAYTRQNAVVLPQRLVAAMHGVALERLVAHELFHVATRAHPDLADSLYAVIGFRRCGAFPLPEALAARRITNPDAPKDEHCIEVEADERKTWAVPLLLSDVTREELPGAGPFLQHVVPALLLVRWAPGGGAPQPIATAAGPRLADFDQVSGFFEQVGRNTRYVIHPEEIVADNFALLALGARNVPSPDILAGVQRVLAEYRGGMK